MARDYNRSDRVGDQLQREIAHLIQTEVKDPRLPSMITCTEVQVSSDLSYAKIYVTFMQTAEDDIIKEALKILNKAAGHLRTLLSKTMKLRRVPELKFIYDPSIVQGQRLQSIIDRAVSDDQKKSDVNND